MPDKEKITKLETILRKIPYHEHEPQEGNLVWVPCSGSKKLGPGHIGMVKRAETNPATNKVQWTELGWSTKQQAKRGYKDIFTEGNDHTICPKCSRFPPE